MSPYHCSKCGASAESLSDGVRRSCDCNAPVVASMSATVRGRGTVCEKPTPIQVFQDLGERIVQKIRSLRRGV